MLERREQARMAKLMVHLRNAEHMVEAGFDTVYEKPVVFKHWTTDWTHRVSPETLAMMRAISTGIDMKAQVDRERK